MVATERRGSAAAERSEAVRWNRLLGARARFKLPADAYGHDLCLLRDPLSNSN